MLAQQKVFAVLASAAVAVLIVELVRRRRLLPEFSWLWLLTAGLMLALGLWYDLLLFLTDLIGAVLPTSALFTFAFLFLILLAVHYSVRMTGLTHQVRALSQELALLRAEMEADRERAGAGDGK